MRSSALWRCNTGLSFLGHQLLDANEQPLWLPVSDAAELAVIKEHCLTLLKNAHDFYPALIVLGDVYYQLGDLELAYRCFDYVRFMQSKQEAFVMPRMDRIQEDWEAVAAEQDGFVVMNDWDRPKILYQDRHAGFAWVEAFQSEEARRLSAKESIAIADIVAAMEANPDNAEIIDHEFVTVGAFAGEEINRNHDRTWRLFFAFLIAGLLLLYVAQRIFSGKRGKSFEISSIW